MQFIGEEKLRNETLSRRHLAWFGLDSPYQWELHRPKIIWPPSQSPCNCATVSKAVRKTRVQISFHSGPI